MATLEAVLFLPLLILIFAGIQFVTHAGLSTLKAKSQARSCAWQISASGCNEIPPECQAERDARASDPDARDRLDSSGALNDLGESSTVKEEVTRRVEGLLVDRISATARVAYKKPLLLLDREEQRDSGDPTDRSAQAEYRLPCNEKPKHTQNLAKALFEELL